ncbi:MAG: hypothetical protein ABL949_11355 [Fimbriimonadaceae bacterium]
MKRYWLYLVGLLIILACGGGGAGGGTVTVVTDGQRVVAIQAVNAKFEEIHLAGGTVNAQNQALASYIATRPEFEASGYNSDDGCAWGRFNDGRLLVIGNNRFPDRSRPSSFNWTRSSKASFVGKSQQARLMHAFGASFSQLQVPIADMSRYLQKDNLFTVVSTPEGKARLTDLRAVNGDAFWYINAHGGKGTTKSGEELFVVASSTPYDAATEATSDVKLDWDNDRLCYYTGLTGDTVNGVEVSATTYAINHKFVTRYMSFSPNAVVFLNVCFTGNSHLQVAKFRDAILNKGAGVVMGWTQLCNSSTAFDASRYFVDRLVAANDFQKETPDQRSFAVVEVLADMARKGKDKDGTSLLRPTFKLAVTNVGLRPTIRNMTRDELEDTLILYGEFGSESGDVLVNGVKATLVGNWDNQMLKVRIPATGNGSDGPVVVEVHGKKSKERYLTSFRGTYTYSFVGAGTLTESASANIHLRLDLEKFRIEAGGQLVDSPQVPFQAASDSTLTWACSGAVYDIMGLATSWSGGGSPPLKYDEAISAPVNAWSCSGFYDPATKSLLIALVNGGPKDVFARGLGSGPQFPGSQSSYFKPLNADWSAPEFDAGPSGKWSKLSVTWPPPTPFYQPIR